MTANGRNGGEARVIEDPYAVNSLWAAPGDDPVAGQVVWDPVRSLWNGAMALAALTLTPFFTTPGAVAAFVVTTGLTLMLGHSVGYHRRLIHRSFQCPKWVEYVLVWFGTAVGMSGPLWMIRAHDVRDWGQRQPDCHPALRHAAPIATDYLWNLHGRLVLEHPPRFDPGPGIADNRFYRFLEATWMLHQVPIAVGLYLMGGWPWVVWGVCVRVFLSVTGHWFVGRFAHREGPQTWLVEGAGVQAFDVPWAAIPTMGEAWHNNHHAFPGSAKMGLYPGQADWGFKFLQLLEAVGLAWDIRTPDTLPERACLRPAPRKSRAAAHPLPPGGDLPRTLPLFGGGKP